MLGLYPILLRMIMTHDEGYEKEGHGDDDLDG